MSNLATIGWPTGTDTGWPSEPRNMLPGRIEGYPQGSQRSANTAERLLSQAVGWWDAAAYRDGDRLLPNRGVAGELLDLQLGSSDRVATTNDPLFLAPEDSGYVYLPGVASNFLSVPNEAALDITGDIDLRVKVALDNWTPSADNALIGKWPAVTANNAFYVRVRPTGLVDFQYTPPGGTQTGRTSTVATNIENGSTKWVRVTVDVDNGAGGNDVMFYLSDDGATWTQLGSTVTNAGTVTFQTNTFSLQVGTIANVLPAAGKVYQAQVWDGIEGSGGTKVLDIDCDAITDGSATSFTAVTNQTVTINRSTSGRKSVAVPRRNGGGRSLFLLGTDDYFECVGNWQHQLLNFGQEEMTAIAIYRIPSFTANQQVISKGFTGFGYNLRSGVGVPANGIGSAGADPFVLRVSGVSVHGVIRTLSRVTAFVNNATNSIETYPSVNLSNTDPFRIGRSAGTVYQDMEFTSAAVFRKALTPDEIKTITDYYQNRGF